MKKFFLVAALALCISAAANAKDTYAHDASVLPEAARSVISNNFKSKVSVVKIEKDLGHISEYEVVLTDGTEITFDSKGNWLNVETSVTKSIPQSFILQAISDFVKKNHKGGKIVGIEKNRAGYEVDLANGIEMKFDKSGNFIKYDD